MGQELDPPIDQRPVRVKQSRPAKMSSGFGCRENQIVISLARRSILDAHYLNRDPAFAESAIRKLEARTKAPDRGPHDSHLRKREKARPFEWLGD